MLQINTLECKTVTIDDERLTSELGGFALEGVTTNGTSGVIIFLPTGDPNTLIEILRRSV